MSKRKGIVGWSNGRDPSEFGWVFEDGTQVSCADLQDATSWEDAERLVPPDVIEAAKSEGIAPEDLSDFLQRFN